MAGGHWHAATWAAFGVAAVMLTLLGRLVVHTLLGYRTELRTEYRGEWTLLGALAAGYSLSFLAGHIVLRGLGFMLLLTSVVLYELLNDAITRTRAAQDTLTATQWVRGRRIWGHELGALSDEGTSASARTVSALSRSHDKQGRRLIRDGASLAGTIVAMLLTSTTVSYASSTLSAGPAQQRETSPPPGQVAPPSVPEVVQPTASPQPDGPTYDGICGREALQPGDTAPDWAQPALHQLWLGSDTGVGGVLAGCVEAVQTVRGHSDAVYQTGYLNGTLRGVGVSIKSGPTTMYLDGAADGVLKLLKAGRVVVGHNGGVRDSLRGIRQLPSGRLYVP
jgi:hypothetical protein